MIASLTKHLPRLAIVGRGRCGKDTAGDFLKDHYNLRFVGGCSWAGKEYVAERLGISVEEAWATRHLRRMEWYNILNEYRKDDWARLIRRVFETSDFVCGIRDGEELRAAREEGLLDLIVWVERAQAPFDPTLQFGPEDCDVVITNHTTIPDYLNKLNRFAKSLGLPKRHDQPEYNSFREMTKQVMEEARFEAEQQARLQEEMNSSGTPKGMRLQTVETVSFKTNPAPKVCDEKNTDFMC